MLPTPCPQPLHSQMMLLGAGSSGAGGSSGTAEITELTVSGGPVAGTQVLLADADGMVGFWVQLLAQAHVVDFDFAGLTDADFATGANGKYLDVTGAHYFWANTGGEADPSASGTAHEVTIAVPSTAADIAAAFAAAIDGAAIGWSAAVQDTTKCRLTNGATGAVTGVSVGNTGASAAVITLGRDADGAAPGTADREVAWNYAEPATLSSIATALAAAIDADAAFSASAVSDVVTVTAAATGPRTDAVDETTVLSVNITQQGT